MRRIYLDHNATSPATSDHLELVFARLKSLQGNPSSIHQEGREAKVALEDARGHVARLLGCRPLDVVFTSGATEANNFVIQGVTGREVSLGRVPQLVTSSADHSSVLEPVRLMHSRKIAEASLLPVIFDGSLDEQVVIDQLTPKTALVSLIVANNEVGTINHVARLAKFIKEKRQEIHVHVDAVQAFGKIDLSWMATSAIDSAALSGHKFGAFKGVGALYLRGGVKFQTLIAGGGQERARRPGTENMPGILSFGERCAELQRHGIQPECWRPLQQKLISGLKRDVDGVVVHGVPEKGMAHTVNFHIEGVSGDDVLLNLDLAGIGASSGSACSSGVGRPSHVLLAMGYPEWVALNSVRISFGPGNTESDVDHVVHTICATVRRIRK